jgi:SAM-dependent methyltransferase
VQLTDPFDALAASYDDHFSKSRIGRLMRSRVWKRLDSCFSSGQRVLDLGCGTGEDAVHLGRRDIEVLATDRSAEMVGLTREKVARVGLESHVRVERLALESLHELASPMFDGALSNFGGLNCVADLPAVSKALAARLRPGATAMLCLMGPVVPWEWVWFLAHGEPGKAFRRLKRGGADWRGLKIHYPSVGAVCRDFSSYFELSRVGAIGALLPPPFTEPWSTKHPGLLQGLNRWEQRLEACAPLPWLSDHYLLELRRA